LYHSGIWDFKSDPDEVGESNGWFNRKVRDPAEQKQLGDLRRDRTRSTTRPGLADEGGDRAAHRVVSRA
jgi:hypothetical protein